MPFFLLFTVPLFLLSLYVVFAYLHARYHKIKGYYDISNQNLQSKTFVITGPLSGEGFYDLIRWSIDLIWLIWFNRSINFSDRFHFSFFFSFSFFVFIVFIHFHRFHFSFISFSFIFIHFSSFSFRFHSFSFINRLIWLFEW